ncbi:hypothetical protein K2173_022683 [Erythroxylum novogranatense]|uniref:Uncharacterized protein n=1 Tax=Erythroxylum novogranatense TaxID=1862640 RepID=A0AAV8TQ46_9ROSI|nr:hypothetical protein K2173_022683 [Erythroxylum novogranatense]
MGTTIPSSLPTAPHHTLFPKQLLYNTTTCTSPTILRYPSKLSISLCSSSSPTTIVKDGSTPSPPGNDAFSLQSETRNQEFENILTGGCKACGGEEIEKGCNGEGRIQGGIATVPGFGWWPIKAYRPCPSFVASGGRYRRQGQSMDEVAFGRAEPTSNPVRTSSKDDLGKFHRKKKQEPKRFRR